MSGLRTSSGGLENSEGRNQLQECVNTGRLRGTMHRVRIRPFNQVIGIQWIHTAQRCNCFPRYL